MNYGLIGKELGHSFSKEIHEILADYTYELVPLTKEEFPIFMKHKDFNAINVTIPYKKDVIPYLDTIDEHAKAIGAVNTIVQKNGKLKGYNTDFDGFLYMVRKHNIHMEGKTVLVIGNGGASAAIQTVVKHEKASEMIIVSRHGGNGAITYQELYKRPLHAQVIINTSPVGMYPNNDDSPIDVFLFPNCEAVLDVIYNPMLTKLCLMAKERGIPYVNGLEMLIGQAKYAIEYFLDTKLTDTLIQELYQDMLYQRRNLIFIGMPSSGKTTIGKMLASTLNKQFIDVDELIVKKTGMTIPAIFEMSKEEGFRTMEAETVQELASQNNKIIATGGGTIKRKENMDRLQQNGIIFFIDRDLNKLISTDTNRPLSTSKEALQKMYEERFPLYQKYANYSIVNNNNIEYTVQQIVHLFQKDIYTNS